MLRKLDHLCDPIKDPETLQDVSRLYKQTQKWSCNIRPVSVEHDLEAVVKWQAGFVGKERLPNAIKASVEKEIKDSLGSDSSQPLIGMVDKRRVLYFKVYKLKVHDLDELLKGTNKDYAIELFLDRSGNTREKVAKTAFALETFVEYAKGFKDIERLFCRIDVTNKVAQHILKVNHFAQLSSVRPEADALPYIIYGLSSDKSVPIDSNAKQNKLT